MPPELNANHLPFCIVIANTHTVAALIGEQCLSH